MGGVNPNSSYFVPSLMRLLCDDDGTSKNQGNKHGCPCTADQVQHSTSANFWLRLHQLGGVLRPSQDLHRRLPQPGVHRQLQLGPPLIQDLGHLQPVIVVDVVGGGDVVDAMCSP
jgi:hypothetical protein